MVIETKLQSDIINAYLKTSYVADLPGTPTLKINELIFSKRFLTWVGGKDSSYVIITGYNPMSSKSTNTKNVSNNLKLLQLINNNKYKYCTGRGTYKGWSEEHFIVVNVPDKIITKWMDTFSQAAVVVGKGAADSKPELKWNKSVYFDEGIKGESEVVGEEVIIVDDDNDMSIIDLTTSPLVKPTKKIAKKQTCNNSSGNGGVIHLQSFTTDTSKYSLKQLKALAVMEGLHPSWQSMASSKPNIKLLVDELCGARKAKMDFVESVRDIEFTEYVKESIASLPKKRVIRKRKKSDKREIKPTTIEEYKPFENQLPTLVSAMVHCIPSGSGCHIGDGRILTCAHCVSHDGDEDDENEDEDDGKSFARFRCCI